MSSPSCSHLVPGTGSDDLGPTWDVAGYPRMSQDIIPGRCARKLIHAIASPYLLMSIYKKHMIFLLRFLMSNIISVWLKALLIIVRRTRPLDIHFWWQKKLNSSPHNQGMLTSGTQTIHHNTRKNIVKCIAKLSILLLWTPSQRHLKETHQGGVQGWWWDRANKQNRLTEHPRAMWMLGWSPHKSASLYPRPMKLDGGYTGFTLSSVRPSVRLSVCRRHSFRSISQVCFGISNFICMLTVVIGRSLLIFSDVTFKMAAWQPYWIFCFQTLTLIWLWISTPNFSGTILIYIARSLQCAKLCFQKS